MNSQRPHNNLLFLLYLALIAYLLMNTGIMSDEFGHIKRMQDGQLRGMLLPKACFIDAPLQHYIQGIWYRWCSLDNTLVISLAKIIYIATAFYLIAQFFSIYLQRESALWASFMFIFFPVHDSTAFFFLGQYLTISFALYLYSYYLAHHNRFVLAFLSAGAASFISYGSTPIALALFILFVLQKEIKKGIIILIPNIIYVTYFIPINMFARIGHPRIIEALNIGAAFRQFALQGLTFVDSAAGVSMWLKIYYAFWQLSLASSIVGIIAVAVFYKTTNQPAAGRYDRKLITALGCMLLFSFSMFALTGRYPQLAFNLGNRVTIYGSFLLTYLIVAIANRRMARTLVFAVMVFATLGISGHWKNWHLRQQGIIANIKNNYDLRSYDGKKVIFVSGNQYSKYGPFSHIEFLSEDWVVDSLFNLALNRNIDAAALGKRHKVIDGYLVDTKYNRKRQVDDYINVYDSEKDIIFKLKTEEVNDYIDSLPSERRHWLQILDIEFIKEAATRLMPRLRYAL